MRENALRSIFLVAFHQSISLFAIYFVHSNKKKIKSVNLNMITSNRIHTREEILSRQSMLANGQNDTHFYFVV
jgi:hypothetical protein